MRGFGVSEFFLCYIQRYRIDGERLGMHKIKNVPLQFTIIAIVVLATVISLGTTGILLQQVIERNERQIINLRLKNIAQMAASNQAVINSLSLKASRADQHNVQKYAQNLTKSENIDFVVVMDKQLIRLSHPNVKQIGKKFSSPRDAARTLQGKEHFSKKIGILGLGYRYFVPVYSKDHHIVGLVSVGLTENTILQSVKKARRPIVMGLSIGLIISIVGSILLAKRLKRVLLNMEPHVIAKKLVEKSTIENSMMEGLLVIDVAQIIIAKNIMASKLIPDLGCIGDKIPVDIYQTFFTITSSENHTNRVVFNRREYLCSVANLTYPELGSLVLFRDITDLKEIMEELDGTKQYAQALRAQTHEFMNKLQAISGLIELKKYHEVTELIPQLTNDYHKNFGYITSHIKMPVIAGFLIGKINYAKEKEVVLKLQATSYIPNLDISGKEVTNIIKLVGNLIDNAVDAVEFQSIKKIDLFLRYDDDGNALIIEIIDSGIGMSDEQRTSVLSVGFSTKGKHRGFGLATVNDIIKAHQGFIDIKSQRDFGTEIYIEYPLDILGV